MSLSPNCTTPVVTLQMIYRREVHSGFLLNSLTELSSAVLPSHQSRSTGQQGCGLACRICRAAKWPGSWELDWAYLRQSSIWIRKIKKLADGMAAWDCQKRLSCKQQCQCSVDVGMIRQELLHLITYFSLFFSPKFKLVPGNQCSPFSCSCPWKYF